MATTERRTGVDWVEFLHGVKEKMTKVLWSLPGVTDGERELALKEFLWELEQIQNRIQENTAKWENAERIYREENDLFRSLLGTGEHELRGRVLSLAQEMQGLRKDALAAQEELAALRRKAGDLAEERAELRRALKEAEQALEILKSQEDHDWQSRMSGFADEQSALQKQFLNLAQQMKDVQGLLSGQAQEMDKEKQAQLTEQQAQLLKDMEAALSQREELLWAEEELFARGAAQKLRGELQAGMGRLQLTLERFGLLESPEKPAARTWDQWWRLLKAGPEEFQRGFSDVAEDLKRAVRTLEEYMTLTHRQVPVWEDVALPTLVQEILGALYADRLEKGAVEYLVADRVPVIRGDKALLKTAIQAILDNAFESIPKNGGRVRLQIDPSPEGNHAWITVTDNGPGISEPRRQRLFQPFFTTKAGHRGLGLARARRYAEWHRGRLDAVDTQPGNTVFRLSLPGGL